MAAPTVRYVGQLLAWYAAYRRRPVGIALGAGVVVLGWSHGLLDTSVCRRVRRH